MSESYDLALADASGNSVITTHSSPLVRGLISQCQLDLALEPHQLYKTAEVSEKAQFALCTKERSGKLRQQLFTLDRLDWAVRQAHGIKREDVHVWISQSTLKERAVDRRISSIVLLNACWLDIDLEPSHCPPSFDKSLLPNGGDCSDPELLARVLAFDIEEAGLPAPSYIVATGGGLCPKWLFDAPLAAVARPRWQSVQRQLVRDVSSITGAGVGEGWAWPVDAKASDAARILRLVGTHNPRWGKQCRVVWESGQTYNFDSFADRVLPYSRAEVDEWRARQVELRQYDKNRDAAAAAGVKVARKKQPEAAGQASIEEAISDEAVRELWSNRFQFCIAVLEHRGGANEGQRNAWAWIIALCLAYSCSSVDDIKSEIVGLHLTHFRGQFTREEVLASAASVLQRKAAGDLYRMRTKTLLEKLEVSATEKAAFGHLLGKGKNAARGDWNAGAMGFEKIKDLDFPDFLREVRERQSAAARRTNELGLAGDQVAANAASQAARQAAARELRAQAAGLRTRGMSQQAIAATLGVNQASVSRWLKSA